MHTKTPRKSNTKIVEFADLTQLREKYASNQIVHCHGVFDVLHAGHLAYFESAKKYGDILVVSLTSDEFVNKGPGRPYFNAAVRARMLAALEVIDHVCVNKTALAVPAIEALKPNFYVKGPDYKDRASDITGGIREEEAAVESGGGKLVFTDDETFSSSTLINKFFTPWNDNQEKTIRAIQEAGGFARIEEILEKLSRESVNVVGEPIVDTYRFCLPENISSKSPSVSAKYVYEENYAGGSLAIANHLSDFVKNIDLMMTHGGEPYFREILKEKMDPRVRITALEIPNFPTPRKTRYISIHNSQRIFELTDLRSDQWLHHSPKDFCDILMKRDSKDLTTIVADFGHGLFEEAVLETIPLLKSFVGINVQSNSSNFGFNLFHKHKKFSFLSIDTREAQLAYQTKNTPPIELARRISRGSSHTGAGVIITRGSHGAYYMPGDSKEEFDCPAFADSVVDATGAGDAFFAITTMLVKVNCPHIFVPFLGNVFAGLKTRIIGNKSSVSKAQFVKAVSAILK
jgi:rfaE bifunctional protein nucleotidyltransferase chain/domain